LGRRLPCWHSPSTDGGAVGGDEDGLGELDEGVEDLRVVLDDEAVEDLGIHRLQGAAQVDAWKRQKDECNTNISARTKELTLNVGQLDTYTSHRIKFEPIQYTVPGYS